jgi:LCP family protein required for cell wall assembly
MRAGAIGARVIAAALSMVLLVYIGYLWSTVRGLNDVQRLEITALGGQQTDNSGHTTTRHDIDGEDQNLLIVGNDDRNDLTDKQVRELKVGRDGGSLNTDTVMIVHIPADGSQATLISLPRDSYVNIPGYGMNKLNAAYPFGYNDAGGSTDAKRAAGADLLTGVVESLTGLNIDHFVQVSLLGFVTISDAVHGVTVNLCHSVDDTVAHNRSLGIKGGSGLVLSKGVHAIQGVQALAFVRQRDGLPGIPDVARAARQRYFLTAAFRAVASAGTLLNISRLQNLVAAVKKSIYVDKTLDVFQLAKQLANLSANNIRGEVIPTDHYEPTSVGDVGVVVPAQVRAFVQKVINGGTTSDYQKAKTVDPSTVTVTVRNYGNQNGAAAQASGVLTKAGFSSSVDSAATGSQTTTTIQYPKGSEAQAKTLARYVHGAAVEQGDIPAVTLTLGSDGILPTATAATTTHPAPSTRSGSSSTTKSPPAIDSKCIN